MTDTFFQELQDELQKGIHKKGHPFRYCTLATVGLKHQPQLRTVVLRRVSENLKLTFYTDWRSKKIIQIKKDDSVSLLFYNPKKLLQIKVEGHASIVTNKRILQKYWSGVQPNSRKDYTTDLAPGSSIPDPDRVTYLNDENHFCMVDIEPVKIEYLKLKRPNHLRVQFTKEGDNWIGEFLVP